MRGIGPQTATAILASIDKGQQFDKSRDLLERLGMNRTIVALAAKNARIIWSLLHNQTQYEYKTA